MELTQITSQKSHLKGIFVQLTREEGFRIASSLMGQIRTNNPNTEREEFYPQSSKYNYFTISVKPEPIPPNLSQIFYDIQEEILPSLTDLSTPHRRGIDKGINKVLNIMLRKFWGK